MKNILLLILLLYFLILFQTGFLNFLKTVPNFVLITILTLAIFQKRENFNLIPLLFGGFFLDIFSGLPFGVATLSLVLVYFLSLFLLRIFLKINFFEVAIIFILSSLLYKFLIPSFNYLFGLISQNLQPWQFNFTYLTLIEIILNLVLGIIVFGLIKKYGLQPTHHPSKRQLQPASR
ncbi:MAG: rod shape-determining protein MreD [Candidatus Nealsonbacteria bacterium CG10_big_fil_rev_8_21_14_0_10_36_23]|uniref:Rod shape-determining protein MreD n=1 Tax=Candidatus Nealsonbacteria bacterium CG10_big_fil_rev_8_21_14_0_10_36_23 TaxID=1974709 RepID=A0A2H0TLP3_9BACT|nr:MAG: rod shape-determining protein MreD [Candidatus Nealsonbacteria bacterium CG10_big_fil_rev_8_21_14_0_10_36_23]